MLLTRAAAWPLFIRTSKKVEFEEVLVSSDPEIAVDSEPRPVFLEPRSQGPHREVLLSK